MRHAGHGEWGPSVADLLALTKMDWNNDSLYSRLPVTLAYSQVLARALKRLDVLEQRPYQFRFFM